MANFIIVDDIPLESEQNEIYNNPRQIELFPELIEVFCLLCSTKIPADKLYCSVHERSNNKPIGGDISDKHCPRCYRLMTYAEVGDADSDKSILKLECDYCKSIKELLNKKKENEIK